MLTEPFPPGRIRSSGPFRASRAPAWAAAAILFVLAAAWTTAGVAAAASCPAKDRALRFGFYAYFEPVSHSADRNPASPGFHDHRGYEADLLTALESMDGAGLSFIRRGIAAWDDIWLLPAGPDHDIVGGGITVLPSRTRDAAGNRAIVFTGGHIRFRQSLLVRAGDARRLARYADLDGSHRVGVLAGTTGEARLLELAGIADAEGILAAGTQVETPRGTAIADGGSRYTISAAGASPVLEGRRVLRPASNVMPRVIWLADETALIEALRTGGIDAVARGEIGNRAAARAHGGELAVTALDSRAETGGFALAVEDAATAARLDRLIAWLTDGGRIGYGEWLDDPTVFLRRARQWPGIGR